MFKYIIIMTAILGQVCGSGGDVQNVEISQDSKLDQIIKQLKSNSRIKLEHIIKNNGHPDKSGCSLIVQITANQAMKYESIVLDTFPPYINSFAKTVCKFIITYSKNQYNEGLEQIRKLVESIKEVDAKNKHDISEQQKQLHESGVYNKLSTEIHKIITKLHLEEFLQDTSWQQYLQTIEQEITKHKIYKDIADFWQFKCAQNSTPTNEQKETNKDKTQDLKTKLNGMPLHQKTDAINNIIRVLGYINTTSKQQSFLEWNPNDNGTKEQNTWKQYFEQIVAIHKEQEEIQSILDMAQTILNTRKALNNSIFFLNGINEYLGTFSGLLNIVRAQAGVDIRPKITEIKTTIQNYINQKPVTLQAPKGKK